MIKPCVRAIAPVHAAPHGDRDAASIAASRPITTSSRASGIAAWTSVAANHATRRPSWPTRFPCWRSPTPFRSPCSRGRKAAAASSSKSRFPAAGVVALAEHLFATIRPADGIAGYTRVTGAGAAVQDEGRLSVDDGLYERHWRKFGPVVGKREICDDPCSRHRGASDNVVAPRACRRTPARQSHGPVERRRCAPKILRLNVEALTHPLD